MAQGDVADGDDGYGDHGSGYGDGSGGGENARASDARLTELLRTHASTAYPALRELRRRHHPRVLDYARLCTASESSARQLAAQTQTTAARETARGVEPRVPLRHQLLLLTARSAATWAADERAAGVDPGLLLVLNTSGTAGGPTPPLLPAFRSLPSRTQGLIWYGVVEREPTERTATFLGLTHEDVTYGIPQALQAMSQACLRSRLAASDDPGCGDFRRLIEESVRPGTPRYSADLHAHMGHCPHCTAAYENLTALRDDPRTALAEGLLPWSGTAYVRDEGAVSAPDSPAAQRSWPSSRRLLLASAALGVALAPILVFLLAQADTRDSGSTAATVLPTSPPVTVTTTATLSPSPSPSTERPSPSPTRTSHPPRTSAPPKPKPTPRPTPSPPGAAYAQVVNAATGRCLDVRDGDFEKGTDVITAPCSASATQRWRVDTGRGVVQSAADPDFCLDSRGSVDRGVGIWECSSVYGSNGQNLRFTVDSDGVIRPAIAIETAVAPDGDGGDGMVLEPLDGGAGQRWRAGAV
ncbi:RICIN domain-containing protein [Streptomyces sp. NPDC001982]|uniref:RICIN domain-containing protein n=1 Tax=Streptomyces sp. NPDC001982 TaxID=3154405 RepID=UPI00331F526F